MCVCLLSTILFSLWLLVSINDTYKKRADRQRKGVFFNDCPKVAVLCCVHRMYFASTPSLFLSEKDTVASPV